MKCLEPYTIEQVKEMSFEELKGLCEEISKEEWMAQMKQKIVNMIDVMDARTPIREGIIGKNVLGGEVLN